MTNNGNFDLFNNINITIYNSAGNIKHNIKLHNKAGAGMIQGILRFLRGEFNPSNITNDIITHDVNAAKTYIPSYISFGNGGINVNNNEVINNVVPPTFYDNTLENELVNSEFRRIPLSKSEVGISHTNDMGNLALITYVPAGYYTNVTGTDKVYLSEIGLFANNYDGNKSTSGKMLARAVFTTPITQEKDDVILVQWNIGAISINDGWWTQDVPNEQGMNWN